MNRGARSRSGACAAIVAWLLVCALLAGCDRSAPTQPSATEQGAAAPEVAYDPGITAQSTPTEVVQRAIQGLDEDNPQLLAALVAARHEAEAVNQIFRRHGKKAATTPQAAAALAAAGWRATYALFKQGATRVEQEHVNGDTAIVIMRGENGLTGAPAMLRFNLIREDGLWKIKAGLHVETPANR